MSILRQLLDLAKQLRGSVSLEIGDNASELVGYSLYRKSVAPVTRRTEFSEEAGTIYDEQVAELLHQRHLHYVAEGAGQVAGYALFFDCHSSFEVGCFF